jgi:hypothetical protein
LPDIFGSFHNDPFVQDKNASAIPNALSGKPGTYGFRAHQLDDQISNSFPAGVVLCLISLEWILLEYLHFELEHGVQTPERRGKL